MKAAIIGGGFAGATHAEALRACGVEPAVVITAHAESAKRFAEQWKIERWGTDPELAAAADINAVHICTPPTSHGKYIRFFLERGKNILCEKPLCFDPEEAAELAELAKKRGTVCALTFNVRYHMACQKAKQELASGKFGRPLLVHGSYLQEFGATPAFNDWRFNPKLGGEMRAVTEIGTHWLDIAQYISGQHVKAVSAQFGHFAPMREVREGLLYPADRAEIVQADSERSAAVSAEKKDNRTGSLEQKTVTVCSEDAAVVSLRFESGAIGSMVLSEVSQGRGNRLSLEITCENGNLWWNEEENNLLHTARKGEGVHTEVFAFGNGFGDTFTSLLKNFYKEIESGVGTTDLPDLAEGAEISRICDAIYHSAKENSVWKEI